MGREGMVGVVVDGCAGQTWDSRDGLGERLGSVWGWRWGGRDGRRL